ncbi:BrnT family toxin [Gluconobacter cerinus]|uniref:BrnT family toxin n=1 Tax=Gluconobacter cerinus TaxID=38307 RepID=UPI001B8BE82D|nr:BrnT family toxin [Gluconobacter cerinus]MBS1023498.1 BrnT family toxin [Gluconobacter cerinus]
MIEFDEAKRQKTLTERGLDFADAELVFEGDTGTLQDIRKEYPEARYITAGYLNGRFVIVGWCWRGTNRRVFTMRYGHDKEERKWKQQLGRS